MCDSKGRQIGLLFHGAEIIDTGEAKEAMELLKREGLSFEAALGGITGKTAVIDAGLEDMIDISKNKRPSQVIEDFVKEGISFIILLNHGVNEERGLSLGQEILANFISRNKEYSKKLSFIQIEYSSKVIFRWLLREEEEGLYAKIVRLFGFTEKEVELSKPNIYKEGDLVYREVKGVLPNEKILVNGVVIGISPSEGGKRNITLVAKGGRIIKMLGGTLIKHNLQKLPPLKLEEAIVKTTSVFRRIKPQKVKIEERMREGKGKACIFFDIENLFPKIEEEDVMVVVTIGDDTTSLAGDILKRFGIRLIGITDGDADGLIYGIETGALHEYEKFLPKESVIIRLKPERDDIVGMEIKREIFRGKEEIEIEFEELRRRIMNLVKEDIIGMIEKW
ncbi:MAG: DUF2117 domain-containing protein [Candidatus Methanospirareceae archaeon]